MKKFSLRKVLGIAVVLSCAISLAACANNVNDTNNGNNGTTDDNQVAGATQELIYGYILEINPQARVALIDKIELVSYSDTERIDALHLDRETDFINGYHIYNSSIGSRLYPLASSVNLSLSDFDYSNSSAYNRFWNNTGNAQGLTSDLTNTDGANGLDNDANNMNTNNTNSMNNDNANTDNDGSPLTVKGGFLDTNVNDNDNDIYNLEGDTLIEEITENDQNTNNGEENLVDGTANNTGINHSSQVVYSGTELSRLNDRLDMYDNIPFLITLENGRIVKIEEMDSLYH